MTTVKSRIREPNERRVKDGDDSDDDDDDDDDDGEEGKRRRKHLNY